VSKLGELYRTALVTGASAGLGRAFADLLLEEGVRVWGTGRDPARLPTQDGFAPVVLDLDAPDSVSAAFRQAEEAAGGLDLVINCAGYGVFGPFAAREFADWQRQIDAMLVRTTQLAHLALQGMLARRRGALVTVTSLAVEFPLPFMSGYNVAKAGLSAFCESLMVEVAGSGVIILEFRPGDHRTGFNQSMEALSAQSPVSSASAPRTDRVWERLEENLRSAPPPARAARDLRRALLRGRSGVVRSGSLVQAHLAPWLTRVAPAPIRRAVIGRYFRST
jgi:uncharacterized protein